MKKSTFSNLLLLTTITLFTACSNKTAEPKTVSELLGIQQARIATLPMAQTYPMEENINVRYQPIVPYRYSENTSKLKNQIEWNAKKLLGIKYVWGATGPYTYDCSGFTQKIYRDAGISIPRVSRDQAKVGTYVSYASLKKGDMVFFDTKKKRTGKVSHVGIYLGSGNFIHASSSAKKIVIYNFNQKDFYKKRFLWGRRVVQSSGHLASL